MSFDEFFVFESEFVSVSGFYSAAGVSVNDFCELVGGFYFGFSVDDFVDDFFVDFIVFEISEGVHYV